MDIDLDELRRLAEAATPGPWWYDDKTDHGTPLIYQGEHGTRERAVVAFNQADYDSEAWFDVEEKDAEFIAAADPPTVLALIAEVQRLRARRPVVCGSCCGRGVLRKSPRRPRWTHTPFHGGIKTDCPDCGQDNAGPGVRWEP